MSDATDSRPAADTARQADLSMVAKFFKATELDTRMLGMVGALLLIWILFDIFSGGLFLTPRNLWNLSVQTASIAVMATGMVLIIVTRNIDLSVGSVLGFVGMIMGVTQAEIIPSIIGFDNPFTWILTLAVGVVLGAAIGALHGYIIAYMAVPAFIVTLGGLLVWRGAAWWVTSGAHRCADGFDLPVARRRAFRFDRRNSQLDFRGHRLRCDRPADRQWAAAAQTLQVPASPHVGRDVPGDGRLRAGAGRRVDRQFLLLADRHHP